MSTEDFDLTEGAVEFAKIIEERGQTLKATGDDLGVSDVAVLDWKRGKRRPEKHYRDRICVWSDGRIGPDMWDMPAEREALEQMRERRREQTASAATGTAA
jgi:hypothetical protein